MPAGIFGEFPREPELSEWPMIYWRAFLHLGRFRDFGGMGAPMPIREEAILRYADTHGPANPDDRADFVAIVSDLDRAWLNHKPGK